MARKLFPKSRDITIFEIPIFNIIELEREVCGRYQEIVTRVPELGEKCTQTIDRPKSVILFDEDSSRVIAITDPCQISNSLVPRS